ncbi:MAG: GrpB family protein [Thermomicrobiales bacterium]
MTGNSSSEPESQTGPVHAPIGLRRGMVRLVPHRPEWARLFAAEGARLRATLGDWAIQIEHVGSTAVPGLTAKPIIDIVVAVAVIGKVADAVEALQRLGYEVIPEDPVVDRVFLVKGTPDSRQIHLSLAEPTSTCWRDHVLFRDFLRAQPRAAADYATLKQQLAVQYPEDRAAYTAGKESFIQRVIAAAMLGVDWGDMPNEDGISP